MVNTRTDADLSAAVQNALQAMLPGKGYDQNGTNLSKTNQKREA
nr:hypothetical protein [Tanacetum cinerariifolium]